MKGKDLYRNMSLIDDEIIEKNSKERFNKTRKPLWVIPIAAALAIAILTAMILPSLLNSGRSVSHEPPAAPMQYLTARTFAPSRESGEISEEFRIASANFAFRLLNESKDSYEGSGLLISPLSAMLALAMTANGADAETLAEMENVLAGGMSIEKLNQELFNYTSSFKSGENAKFSIANSIWVTDSPSFTVNPNFVKTVENTYDADIISINMAAPGAYVAINDWVKENTDGMIEKLFENQLDSSVLMILINTLAFDAVWSIQATDDSCKNYDFHGIESTTNTTFMSATCENFIIGEKEEGIVKTYRYLDGGNYAFVALLPNEGIDIRDYIESLDGERFLELYESRRHSTDDGETVYITALIPHFSFDCNLDLKQPLANMGMPRAFNAMQAQFEPLTANGMSGICIDKVIQKTHIDLDNSGTRAAAVTAVSMAGGMNPTTQTFELDLTRPFVYAIVDTQTGLPLFLGACENIE